MERPGAKEGSPMRKAAVLLLILALLPLHAVMETEAITVNTLINDLIRAHETLSDDALRRVDADAQALDDPVLYSVAEHWKRMFVRPDYRLFMLGQDDPASLPIPDGGRGHAFAVLGFELKNGEMTEELKARCEAAAAVANAFPEAILVCTGGPTGVRNPEKHTEAGLMRQYLIAECGIRPARVFADERALDTRENALNCFSLFRQQGIRSVTVVTSDYHQRWAQTLFNAVGALYQYDLGYQVEIIENYGCLSPTISDYPTDYKLAASQLKTLLSGR